MSAPSPQRRPARSAWLTTRDVIGLLAPSLIVAIVGASAPAVAAAHSEPAATQAAHTGKRATRVPLPARRTQPAKHGSGKRATVVALPYDGPRCVKSADAPHLDYFKLPRRAEPEQLHFGQLWAGLTVGGCRIMLALPAGSGNGKELDDCVRFRGPVPDGDFTVDYFGYKTIQSPVVRGWVWKISDHACTRADGTPSYRDDLWIHSQGYDGWPGDDGYKSAGCVKLNQVDRATLAELWRRARGAGAATFRAHAPAWVAA